MKWTAVFVVLACACGPSSRSGPGDDDGTSGDAGNGTGNGNGNGGSNATGNGSDGCSDDAKLIYVVDQSNVLAQFNPMTKTFHQLGTLMCPAGNGAQPFSMAVDRTAQAYVLYEDNKIYKVDTTQTGLPCTVTTWKSPTSPKLQEFGMGYSTDTVGGTTDTLFVAGGADLSGLGTPPSMSTLATIDTTAMTATQVGSVKGWPELTGNANAELWAFFPDVDGMTTPTVAQVDKTTGNFATTYPETSLDGDPAAWAFGFYGGDYWVFLSITDDPTGLTPPPPSTVYQIAGPMSTSGTPGSVVSMTPAGSLVIVGAGVSTCAPTTIQ